MYTCTTYYIHVHIHTCIPVHTLYLLYIHVSHWSYFTFYTGCGTHTDVYMSPKFTVYKVFSIMYTGIQCVALEGNVCVYVYTHNKVVVHTCTTHVPPLRTH